MGEPQAPVAAETTTNKRIPGPNNNCLICYETMHSIVETSLVFCDKCGNGLHKECFQQCGIFLHRILGYVVLTFFGRYIEQASSARDGKSLSCVWCYAKWVFVDADGAGVGAGTNISEEYVNLASVSCYGMALASHINRT